MADSFISSGGLLRGDGSVSVYRYQSVKMLLVAQESVLDPLTEVVTKQPLNLVNKVLIFSVKTRPDEKCTTLIRKTSPLANGIEIIDAAGGRAWIRLTKEDTAELRPGTYVYDVWVEYSTGERYPVITPSPFKVLSGASDFRN